jgi:hypothetical protein
LAGTGIPEESGGFQRNMQESGSNAGIYRNLCKFLLTWPKTGIFLPLPKGGSCEKIPPEKTRIHRNPEESWTGTKNRDLEMIFLKQENAI